MPEAALVTVNRWTEAYWGRRYLAQRDTIPHRKEGLAVLVELLATSPRRVLDLGTGDSSTLALVLSSRPDALGVGLDFSPEMLARAREHLGHDRRVELVEHDLDLPLAPSLGSFDLVVSSFAIHHCVDERKRTLYGEIYDLLEPGGMFANLEHVASPTPALHAAFLHAIGRTNDDDDPSNKLAAVETQLEWLREIGFCEVDCFWKWRELALMAGTKPVVSPA